MKRTRPRVDINMAELNQVLEQTPGGDSLPLSS
jgi:hypothetical protein